MLEDYKVKNLCEDLLNNLTVIKGFLDLNKDKTEIKFLKELMREIQDMIATLRGCLDEISRNN